MRITFQTGDIPETGKQIQQDRKREAAAQGAGTGAAFAYQTNFYAGKPQNWFGEISDGKEKTSSIADFQQEFAYLDAGVQQDYMTVMSHTMSEEDYAKLTEEGFHFEQMDPEEAVTILDKIKAELVRSGQNIAGYTDDLDLDTLAAAVGSESLARALADCFGQADLPLTGETIGEVKQAWDMACRLETPTDGACQYMIDNGMEPRIWDFYLAENSGAQTLPKSGNPAGVPAFYAEEIQGYYTRSGVPIQEGHSVEGESTVQSSILKQIDKVIAQTFREVDEESRQNAGWLMDRGLPLTPGNLEKLELLKNVEFPVQEETFARAAAGAVAAGEKPIYGNLSGGETIYEKAAAVLLKYRTDEGWESLGGDITARRQLEEIRLHMTAEVNVKLLRSGFAIDTAPMEQLLEALKQAESQVAQKLFSEESDTQALEAYRLYRSANRIVEELPALPAQILGPYSQEDSFTVLRFHEEGTLLRETYRKANESYEALMTAPRSDLGDSIRKAFANVDDIARDLGLELTEENRRAVRILGYNRMDMNLENIEKVREADRQVQEVISRLTPAATLKMIRDGVNPLEQSFEELESYFENGFDDYEESAESYSRFLYGLEKNHEITEDERAAYIGIYRMIHQIERSDGAVVGALVNSQAQLQFSNLLSAVRSSRAKHIDVKVEDSFGTLSELVQKGENISGQIKRGFLKEAKSLLTELSHKEQVQAGYNREVLSEIREAHMTDREVAALLKRGEIPVNAGNLLAARELLQGQDYLLWDLQSRMNRKEHSRAEGPAKGKTEEYEQELSAETTENLLEKLEDKDTFGGAYRHFVGRLQGMVQEASFYEADTSLDVRSLQMLNKQLSIAGKLADSEEYVLPMYIGESLARVHLRLERGGAEKGCVHIAVNLQEDGHIEAHLSLKEGSIGGFLTGNTQPEVTKLKQIVDIFSDYILAGEDGLEGLKLEELPIMGSGTYTGMDAGVTNTDGADNMELYRIAKVFLRAVREEEVV